MPLLGRRSSLALGLVLGLLVLLPGAALPAAPLDRVEVENGSVLYGEVLSMTDGTLELRAAFSTDEIVKIAWASVTGLKVDRVLPIEVDDGSTVQGRVTAIIGDHLQIETAVLAGPVSLPLHRVVAVNRRPKKPVTYRGNLTAGLSVTEGNTELRSGSLLGNFESRSRHQRLSLRGRYVYSDDAGQVITRNSRGTVKLDFFLTQRVYLLVSAFFEQDTFQDLNLRTALGGGPGYQLIDEGDFTSRLLRHMQLSAEAGITWFNEDFKLKEDQTSARIRWAVDWDWPVIQDQLTVFHHHEAFPSVEDTDDFYVTTDQGLRFNILDPFITSIQVTWRYNNQPPPNTSSIDTLYLMTLGFSFDSSK